MSLPSDSTATSFVPDCAHVVQFYTSDTHFLDGLGASLGSALRSGESVVAVMTKAHEKGLRKRLSSQGIDLAQATRDGRFVILDAGAVLETFMEPGGPNRQKFLRQLGSIIRKASAAAEAKGKRVVVFGEMVAVLWKAKKSASAIRLEQLWNELAQTHFFYLRCAYPVREFQGKMKGGPYATICAEHGVVLPA